MQGDDVKRIRQSLGLSQAQFSEQFQINLHTLRQWERKNTQLGSVANAYLTCIESNTELVMGCIDAETGETISEESAPS